MNITLRRNRRRKKKSRKKNTAVFFLAIYIFSYIFAYSNIDKIKVSIINTAANSLFETAVAEAVDSSALLINGIESDAEGFYVSTENLAKLKTAVLKETEKGINRTKQFYIPFGNFTGISFLEGCLHPIPVRVSFMGSVKVSFKENFESCGVNQSIYTLIMCVESEMTPASLCFQSENLKLYTEYVLAERLIMGQVPSFYNEG